MALTDASGEVAVVTGAASGIGLALATAFGNRGRRVLLADVDATALDAAQQLLSNQGIEAVGFSLDVRDQEAGEDLANRARELGTLSAVCCNAGVTSTGTNVWETPDAIFDFVFGVNFQGLVNCVRAFTPRLIAQPEPSTIVVTASMAGLVTSPGSGAYAASKAAAIAIAKSLRVELAATAPHVSVVLLNPGMVKTNLMHTSAMQQPGAIQSEFVEASHGNLNELGVEPSVAATWVLDAIDAGRFWAFPPPHDIFSSMFVSELDEMGGAIRGPAA
jgi:NAD(P)-dependent dehydrogenase (short-subunit alcohol dehydrogenase family)